MIKSINLWTGCHSSYATTELPITHEYTGTSPQAVYSSTTDYIYHTEFYKWGRINVIFQHYVEIQFGSLASALRPSAFCFCC